MDRTEHVHIISAGEKIAIAYPAMFRELPGISRTIVFTDSTAHESSPDPETEKHRLAVRNAVTAVQDISASLSIPLTRVVIYPPTYVSVQSALAKIRREYPDARFTFDLSGGSKELCLALFAFAPWLGAQVYSAFDEKTPRNVPLPERSVRSMMENPNYPTILALLLRTNRKDAEAGIHEWWSREYIYKQLWTVYVPSRTKKAKPGDPVVPPVHYRRGRKPAAELTHGTLSTLMRTLEEAGLVEERVSEETKREKSYRITDSGEIAFRFFADPATNTIVRTMVQKA